MIDETFCYDNFFTDEDLKIFERAIEQNLPGEQHFINEGPFAGNLIAEYVNIIHDQSAKDLLLRRIQPLFDRAIYLNYFSMVRLHKPWDIHSDFYLHQSPAGQRPFYSLLIPLDDVPSRTIIFDQFTNSYTDFYNYKLEHDPVDNPVDEQFWKENLSMCWPQDRDYVTVKKVMPWQQRGQVQGFDRKYFHSSDNFHERFSEPKCFINARLCTDANKTIA